MFRAVLLAFLIVPIIEVFVLAQVAASMGWANSIVLMLVISFVGAYLVKAQGFGIMRRVQAQLRAGNMPDRELVDGGLVLFGGTLLLTPGFVTDAVGLACMFPPTRAILARPLMARVKNRITIQTNLGGFFGSGGPRAGRSDPFSDEVIDVDGHEVWPDDRPNGELDS